MFFGITLPSYLNGTSTFPETNIRRNHQTMLWNPRTTRESLIPPAVLPDDPPITISIARKRTVTLAHSFGEATWNPVLVTAAVAMKSA